MAGYNASKLAKGEEPIELPVELAIGDAIAYVGEQIKSEEGLTNKYTFSGSVYFERMKAKGLYTIDIAAIKDRVNKSGMANIFS